MKESMWGYYLVLLGITVSTVMIMVSNMTTTNQQNYYLLREVTNAAMIDAIDYGYYREYGSIKINTEKFVENFLRRFSEGISKTNTYKIDFYSIYENPPSVSIRVTSNTGDYNIAGDSTNIDVVNSIDSILEANNKVLLSEVFYSVPFANCNEASYISNDSNSLDYGYCQLTNRAELDLDYSDGESYIVQKIQEKLPNVVVNRDKIKILDVEFLSVMNSAEDIQEFYEKFNEMYSREEGINSVPSPGSGITPLFNSFSQYVPYLAKNVKDVKVTMKYDEEENKYFLGYGLKFNCEGVNTLDFYRKGTSVSNMQYSSSALEGYERAPFYGNCMVGIKYKVNFYYDNAS